VLWVWPPHASPDHNQKSYEIRPVDRHCLYLAFPYGLINALASGALPDAEDPRAGRQSNRKIGKLAAMRGAWLHHGSPLGQRLTCPNLSCEFDPGLNLERVFKEVQDL
jgi:hypothetical protein